MYFSILIISLIVLLIIHRLVQRRKNRRFYQLLAKLNSLPGYPLIGNTHLLYGARDDIYQKLLDILKNYDTPLVFWSGYIPAVILSKLEDIQEVTAKCAHRETLGFVEETLMNGIVTQKFEQWRKTRRLLNPAFSPFMLKQYMSVFNEQSQITVKMLRQKADSGKSFDAWPYMVNASIDITTENIMGIKPKTQENFGNEYSEALMKILESTVHRLLNPWLHPKIVFDIYMRLTGQDKLVRVLHKFSRKAVISAKRRYEDQKRLLGNTNNNSARKYSYEPKVPKTMIEILLSCHGTDPQMTEKQIQAEFIQIISAGSESTAITMSFLMLMFGIHQNVQERAYAEITSVMGNRQTVTIDDLNKLEFVEQCIKETIRIYTVLPATLRTTTEELKISDNKIIPADCMVILILKAVHENPEFYANPSRWNPENFSPEAVASRPKNSFVGFSLGSRACLGSKYAMTSIKTQLCHMLRSFRIHTDIAYEDIQVTSDVMHRSKNGYPVILTSRDPDMPKI